MSENRFKILFTAGGSPGQEALYRDLQDQYVMFFADMDPQRISPSIPATHRFQIPAATSEDFVPMLSQLCRQLAVDLLVPGVDEELLQIWRAKEMFGATRLFMPKASFVEEMTDKLQMNRIFSTLGLDVPRAVRADESADGLEFPVLVKHRWGRGSRDIYRVTTLEKLPFLLKALDGDLSRWLVQECIVGKEYTVQIVAAADSSLQVILPIHALEKRGSTTVAAMHSDVEIERYCEDIHRHLDPEGCYNVQLIKSADGRVRCFEVNPRISTTFCMVIRTGFDPFKFFCEGVSAENRLGTVPDIRLVRHWINEFVEAD